MKKHQKVIRQSKSRSKFRRHFLFAEETSTRQTKLYRLAHPLVEKTNTEEVMQNVHRFIEMAEDEVSNAEEHTHGENCQHG